MAKDSGQIIGAVLEGDQLEYVSLRRRKSRYETELGATVPAGEARKLLAGADRVVVGLPSDVVLLRVLDLPTVDPEEIEGMVDLQVDKFAPFPTDQVDVSHEVISTGDTHTRVLVAVVQQEALERVMEPLSAQGFLPHRLDVEILGWWELIRAEGGGIGSGRQALLVLDHGAAELMLLQDGQPIAVRSLGGCGARNPEAYEEDLSEETGYTLASIESEWGLGTVDLLQIWHHAAQPTGLGTKLGQECAMVVEYRALESLPPLGEGLARRVTNPDTLNLAPLAWEEERKLHGNRKRMLLVGGSVMLVWFLSMILLYAALQRERSLGDRYTRLANSRETEADEIRVLKLRIDAIDERVNRTHSALECLREVALLLPPDVELSTFFYKQDGELSLRGQAPNPTPVHNFVEGLEKSDLFDEIRTEDIRTSMAANRRQTTYRITAVLPRDDEEAEE